MFQSTELRERTKQRFNMSSFVLSAEGLFPVRREILEHETQLANWAVVLLTHIVIILRILASLVFLVVS